MVFNSSFPVLMLIILIHDLAIGRFLNSCATLAGNLAIHRIGNI